MIAWYRLQRYVSYRYSAIVTYIYGDFNSIKVRLEQYFEVVANNMTLFNSIKVRLELAWMYRCGFGRRNFNSIKVRLELVFDSKEHGIIIFQFHKGTIRTYQIRTKENPLRISIP